MTVFLKYYVMNKKYGLVSKSKFLKGYKEWPASELNRYKHLLKIIKVELSKITNELTNYKNRAVPELNLEKKQYLNINFSVANSQQLEQKANFF